MAGAGDDALCAVFPSSFEEVGRARCRPRQWHLVVSTPLYLAVTCSMLVLPEEFLC